MIPKWDPHTCIKALGKHVENYKQPVALAILTRPISLQVVFESPVECKNPGSQGQASSNKLHYRVHCLLGVVIVKACISKCNFIELCAEAIRNLSDKYKCFSVHKLVISWRMILHTYKTKQHQKFYGI